ncbi:hypothetical protein ACJX0J_035146, partial [Zea mays]
QEQDEEWKINLQIIMAVHHDYEASTVLGDAVLPHLVTAQEGQNTIGVLGPFQRLTWGLFLLVWAHGPDAFLHRFPGIVGNWGPLSDAAALDGISAISDSFTEFNIKANMKNSKLAQALSLLARSNDEKNNIDRLANGEDEEIDAEEIFTVNFALGINELFCYGGVTSQMADYLPT